MTLKDFLCLALWKDKTIETEKIDNCCQKLGKRTDTKCSLRGLTLEATELLLMIVKMYVYAGTHMCQCNKTGDNLYRKVNFGAM